MLSQVRATFLLCLVACGCSSVVTEDGQVPPQERPLNDYGEGTGSITVTSNQVSPQFGSEPSHGDCFPLLDDTPCSTDACYWNGAPAETPYSIDAGPIVVRTPKGEHVLTFSLAEERSDDRSIGVYDTKLPEGLYAEGDTLQFIGNGSAEVPPFEISVTAPPAANVRTPDLASDDLELSRAQPFEVAWEPHDEFIGLDISTPGDQADEHRTSCTWHASAGIATIGTDHLALLRANGDATIRLSTFDHASHTVGGWSLTASISRFGGDYNGHFTD